MREQLGEDYPRFEEAMRAAPPVSLRLHPLKKISLEENYDKVKWNSNGIYLDKRPNFTLDPRFHAGAYYVQEASSMFVGTVVQQLLDPERPVRALDLAAAPGGKSTLLADALPAGSFLLANEVIRNRYQVLRENLIRWGSPLTHSANHDPRDFSGLEQFFELVLVDAPCSGEGMFRKDRQAVSEWGSGQVQLCVGRQQRILSDAMPLVRPGGYLVYCTCTFNETENEKNAEWIASRPEFETVDISIDPEWGIVRKGVGYQFYPHRVRGEGFYLACFRRRGTPVKQKLRPAPFKQLQPLSRRQSQVFSTWIKEAERFRFYQKPRGGILALLREQEHDAQLISHLLRRLHLGTEIGRFKGKDFIPSHDLAMSTFIAGDLPVVELDKQQALRYLKKEIPEIDSIPPGWALVRYQGLNLGWIKGLKTRLNNYLPKHWRIRMDIDKTASSEF